MKTSAVDEGSSYRAGEIARTLGLIESTLPIQRRLVHAEETIFHADQPFRRIYLVNSGCFKLQLLSGEGREQVVGLYFKGDWMGLEGIARGRYGCDAIAMDTGEIWSIEYAALLRSAVQTPALLEALHSAMSRELVRDHHAMMSLCSLPADARVAGFLRYWATALEERGLRNDQITLRMSREEIGNYLGMTLETVSRALSRMARGNVINFPQKGRRDIHIPQIEALSSFIRSVCGASVA